MKRNVFRTTGWVLATLSVAAFLGTGSFCIGLLPMMAITFAVLGIMAFVSLIVWLVTYE